MLKSRSFRSTLALAAVALTASTVHAGDVKMTTTWNGQDAAGNGGPFTAQLLPAGNPFITFCVEGNEYFNNGQYWKEIATSAKGGGLSGQSGGVDELSKGTAWLYSQAYAAIMKGETNALSTLSWTDSASVSHTFDVTDVSGDLSEIQRVIWSFEGEAGAGGAIDSDRFAAIVNLVSSAVGANYADDGKGGNLFGVRVLRLWTNSNLTGNSQDQLIMIPLPAPVALAGAGLLGLGAIRRRR